MERPCEHLADKLHADAFQYFDGQKGLGSSGRNSTVFAASDSRFFRAITL